MIPTEIRRREGGSVSHRPIPQTVMVGGRPEMAELAVPPADLPEDGQDLWRELAPTLIEVGILDRTDRYLFADLCRAWARKVVFGRVIAKHGYFSPGSHGQIRMHPAIAGERAAADEFRLLAALFGLSPVDRTKLGLATLAGQSMMVDLERSLKVDEADVVDVVAGDLDVGLPGV